MDIVLYARSLRAWLVSKNLAPRSSRGQTTVEYMLILASVVAGVLSFGLLFHKKLLGGFFTMVGMVIGNGASSS